MRDRIWKSQKDPFTSWKIHYKIFWIVVKNYVFCFKTLCTLSKLFLKIYVNVHWSWKKTFYLKISNYCDKDVLQPCFQLIFLLDISFKIWLFNFVFHLQQINYDALRDFVPFAQFKKREKQTRRSVTFTKVTGFFIKARRLLTSASTIFKDEVIS